MKQFEKGDKVIGYRFNPKDHFAFGLPNTMVPYFGNEGTIEYIFYDVPEEARIRIKYEDGDSWVFPMNKVEYASKSKKGLSIFRKRRSNGSRRHSNT